MLVCEYDKFILDEENLGEILGVPTDRLGIVDGTTSSKFMKLIVEREETMSGLRLYRKELKPE